MVADVRDHSTILLGLASLLAVRLREQHAWLDWIWKVALIGAVMTSTGQSVLGLRPVGGRWWPWSGWSGAAAPDMGAESRVAAGAGEPVVTSNGASGTRGAAGCCATERLQRTNGSRVVMESTAAVAERTAAFGKRHWASILVGIWLLFSVRALVWSGAKRCSCWAKRSSRRTGAAQ